MNRDTIFKLIIRNQSCHLDILPGAFKATFRLITPSDYAGRIAGKAIVFPREFKNFTKEITMYNIQGKVLTRVIVKKNMLDIRKDCGLPVGLYIIKVQARE